jgi:hypothetical protein
VKAGADLAAILSSGVKDIKDLTKKDMVIVWGGIANVSRNETGKGLTRIRNFALEYDIRKVQEYQVGLKLNGAHLLLAYTDDVKLLGDNIDTIKKNSETLFDASKEVGLEINPEKTKYMLLFHYWNAGKNQQNKIENRLFENVSQLKCLGTTVTNQNLIGEEVKGRLVSVNACYHLVQNLLSSRLLFKNVKIEYARLYFCPWFCMGVKLTL